jgi:hypothetical protein
LLYIHGLSISWRMGLLQENGGDDTYSIFL